MPLDASAPLLATGISQMSSSMANRTLGEEQFVQQSNLLGLLEGTFNFAMISLCFFGRWIEVS